MEVEEACSSRMSEEDTVRNLERRVAGPRQRSRASIACSRCRRRRSKCVIRDGELECENCKQNGLECVVLKNDRRKMQSARKDVNLLRERVALLEQMVVQQQQQQQPPRQLSDIEYSATSGLDENIEASPNETKDISNIGTTVPSPMSHDTPSTSPNHSSASPLGTACSSQTDRSLLECILSTQGHWGYDGRSRSLRYFGFTTNISCYKAIKKGQLSQAGLEPDQPVYNVNDLPCETHDYLLDLYWSYYNSVLQVVCRTAFEESKANKAAPSPFYSEFLHVCLLAMGLRFADRDRPDIRALLVESGSETVLLRHALRFFSHELDFSPSIPTIQALLVLADLSCAAGRDSAGWLYTGIACRQAFDLGLNKDCSRLGLEDREVRIRNMVLCACVMFDQYWALFLGRIPSIRSSDLDASAQFRSQTSADKPECLENMIHGALVRLMLLASKISESVDHMTKALDHDSYRNMISIDHELDAWCKSLPPELRWTPERIKDAPGSLVLLYQQYYTLLILLHRPFTRYEVLLIEEDGGSLPEPHSYSVLNHFSAVSRKVCFNSAIRLARIFKYHHNKNNGRQIFIAGIDHASAAAAALIQFVAKNNHQQEKMEALRHLYWLMDSLRSIQTAYNNAEGMLSVLEEVLEENGWSCGPCSDHEQKRPSSSYLPRESLPEPSSVVEEEAQMRASDSGNSGWDRHDSVTDLSIPCKALEGNASSIKPQSETSTLNTWKDLDQAVGDDSIKSNLAFQGTNSRSEQPCQISLGEPPYQVFDFADWASFDPMSRSTFDDLELGFGLSLAEPGMTGPLLMADAIDTWSSERHLHVVSQSLGSFSEVDLNLSSQKAGSRPKSTGVQGRGSRGLTHGPVIIRHRRTEIPPKI